MALTYVLCSQGTDASSLYPVWVCDQCGAPLESDHGVLSVCWRSVSETPLLLSPVYVVHSSILKRCEQHLVDRLEHVYDLLLGGSTRVEEPFAGLMAHVSSNLAAPPHLAVPPTPEVSYSTPQTVSAPPTPSARWVSGGSDVVA